MKSLSPVLIFAMILATSVFGYCGTHNYTAGVLLISFVDDVELEISETGIVVADDKEIDRILERFGAYQIKDFFGGYIPQDEEYRYMTRNDYILMFPQETDMDLVAQELSRLKGINWAEVDLHHNFCYTPNDPSFNSQWWLREINAERAWDVVSGSDTVIVGALDSGIDWNHPDLVDNIWVNPGEDVDDDHRPFGDSFPGVPGTDNDWNYEDDDENGLSDDFIGYDWVDNVNDAEEGEDGRTRDNNPMDFDGHGTGVNSAMAAVADNRIGGASIAFGCKIMCLRVGYKPVGRVGAILPSAYIPAMAYAADNGVKILNMSFGVYQYSQPSDRAIQNAVEHNVLFFAAAGNDNTDQRSYPANYSNVISVAATNQNSGRANFSNYGNWVDISAPGTSCYTNWFNDTYTSWDGTSVASPIAAGVGALVVTLLPGRFNYEYAQIMRNTTDEINTDQPIGTGQVNAYKAVTRYYYPELSIDEWSLSDPDGNGHPDIGEEIEVRLSVSNQEGWQDATRVMAVISFSRPGVSLNTESVVLGAQGNIAAGDNANNNDSPMSFTVPEGALDGKFNVINLDVTAMPNNYEIGVSQRIMLGTPEIILVDDDGGEELENFIISDLNYHYYNYLHYDVNALAGTLTSDYLSGYDAIFWMTGSLENPLSDAKRNALQGAMDNGSNLFIFGQTLDDQLAGSDFYSDYLYAESVDEDGEIGLESVEGAGEPVISGSRIALAGAGGAGNNTDPDVISSIGNAQDAYRYITNQRTGGIFYDGDNRKHVYFPFAFEAVSGGGGTTSREEIISSILSWFDVASSPETTEGKSIPSKFGIDSVYPNPFNPSASLKISITNTGHTRLRIFDITGREVAVLEDGYRNRGVYSYTWNASNISAGIYFAVLESNGNRDVRKLAFVK